MGFWFVGITVLLGSAAVVAKENPYLPALRTAFDLQIQVEQCLERREAAEWFVRLGLEPDEMELPPAQNCADKKTKLEEHLAEAPKDSPSLLWEEISKRKKVSQLTKEEIEIAFSDSKKFSALEWKIFRQWFGQEITQKLQEKSFSISKESPLLAQSLRNETIVWILDPYRKILPTDNQIDPEKYKKEFASIEILELSPYGNAESQAEELKNILQKRLKQKITIVSSGRASSIVLKTLDLHPSLLTHPNIVSWVNVEGQLYGAKAQKSRGLASAVDTFQEKVLVGVRLQYLESLERSPSLGKTFPILNVLVQRNKKDLLREKILVEGEIVELKNWKEWDQILRSSPSS